MMRRMAWLIGLFLLTGCATAAPPPAPPPPPRAGAAQEFCTGFVRNGLTSFTCLDLRPQR